ncbi:hypothetical protein LMH87_003594 [Akanthomyces muscarius]|uniref:Uncharacterized protein n=1 Tax=Akanthomyces muscarius TaxID=2231603 RepID=A0A9W8Q3X8_AKAMU|nr:hypothetical protein LMH87_003594 [Akanthomyces muscarius]KAJ4144722.1 hypothetical protein LMH87_003594 [Akanthomyces muscarius]
MTSDTMIKVGRGGAGNYHSAPVNKDPASLAPSKSQIARATQPASAPTLTGRGGAGNVVSEPDAAAHAEGKLQDLEAGGSGAQVTATDAAASVAAAVASSSPHHGMLAGRGGAGNWRDTATEAAKAKSAEEAQHNARAQKEATAQVDGELRRPEPTHTRTRHCERRHNR